MTALSPETAARIMGAHIGHWTIPVRHRRRFPLPEIVAGVVLVGMIIGAVW